MDEPEKPKRSDRPNPRNAPCHIWGGTVFLWGVPHSHSGVWFQQPQDFMGQGTGLAARECQNCGNVQLFTKRERER